MCSSNYSCHTPTDFFICQINCSLDNLSLINTISLRFTTWEFNTFITMVTNCIFRVPWASEIFLLWLINNTYHNLPIVRRFYNFDFKAINSILGNNLIKNILCCAIFSNIFNSAVETWKWNIEFFRIRLFKACYQ